MVPNYQPGVFLRNNSQPICHAINSYSRPAFQAVPNASRTPPPVAQVQPPPGYSNINKIERRINANVKRMVNANMKKMMRMMTK